MLIKRFKNLLFVAGVLFILSFNSCKKCYECTCTDDSVLGGCQTLDEKIELCDKGTVGKSVLTIRVIEKEDQGYTCTLK
jgi:hypothetical protein